jgi:hypothetical protein
VRITTDKMSHAATPPMVLTDRGIWYPPIGVAVLSSNQAGRQPVDAGRQSSHGFVRLNVLDRHTRTESFELQIIPLQPFTCRRHPLKITTYTTYI